METNTNQPQKLNQIKGLTIEQDYSGFSEIELSEEEVKKALFEKRKEKAAKLKLAEYSKRLSSEPSIYLPTKEELIVGFEEKSGLKKDSFNDKIINNLCGYFAGEESDQYDLSKGILLFGGVGCGKTSLMEWFRQNPNNPYTIVSCRKVSYDYSEHGAEAIKQFNGIIKSNNKQLGVCFDDLGTEDDKKHFGNHSNVMADIILNRYDKLKIGGVPHLQSKTHITTNLSRKEIIERYGSRVESRLNEMFNIFIFDKNNPDRRKSL